MTIYLLEAYVRFGGRRAYDIYRRINVIKYHSAGTSDVPNRREAGCKEESIKKGPCTSQLETSLRGGGGRELDNTCGRGSIKRGFHGNLASDRRPSTRTTRNPQA